MSLNEALAELDEFLAVFQKARRKEPPSPVELLIICPDCGKNPPFRNRCPKCGGDSWIPAGPVNGIFEWVKARQWRSVVGSPPEPAEPSPSRELEPETEHDRRRIRRLRRKGKR